MKLMGELPRIELFARQQTPGWDVWGNEVESSLELKPQESMGKEQPGKGGTCGNHVIPGK